MQLISGCSMSEGTLGEIIMAMTILLLLSSCACLPNNRAVCNNNKYRPVAARLSDFSSQIVRYFQNRKQTVPSNFDGEQFVMILRQLPPGLVNRKDVDSIASGFRVEAHRIEGGFSVMLCEDDQKIMEDFAGLDASGCRFSPNRVEVKSWNKYVPCSFEMSRQQYCLKH